MKNMSRRNARKMKNAYDMFPTTRDSLNACGIFLDWKATAAEKQIRVPSQQNATIAHAMCCEAHSICTSTMSPPSVRMNSSLFGNEGSTPVHTDRYTKTKKTTAATSLYTNSIDTVVRRIFLASFINLLIAATLIRSGNRAKVNPMTTNHHLAAHVPR